MEMLIINPLRTYRGKDCIETFCNYIKGEARRLYHMFSELPMDPLTKKQWKNYKRSTKCHICYKPFTLGDPKVRDHCHYTGLYRQICLYVYTLMYKQINYKQIKYKQIAHVYSTLKLGVSGVEIDYEHIRFAGPPSF